MPRNFTGSSFTDSGAGNFTPDVPFDRQTYEALQGGVERLPTYRNTAPVDIYNRNDVENYTDTSGGIAGTTLDTGYVLPVVAPIDGNSLTALPATYAESSSDPISPAIAQTMTGGVILGGYDLEGKIPIAEAYTGEEAYLSEPVTAQQSSPSQAMWIAGGIVGLLFLGYLTRGKG